MQLHVMFHGLEAARTYDLARQNIIHIFRCPLFRGPPHYKLIFYYLALFSKMPIMNMAKSGHISL